MDNLGQFWRRASLVQRVAMVAIVLGVAGAAVVLTQWARKPTMSLLYSQLSPEDAAKIVEKLRDADVAYELKEGGTTILVDDAKKNTLRLEMAAAGLPAAEQGGYSILDQEKIGASPFTQQKNYARAIEGELAKSIMMIEGVLVARVHLVKPESSLLLGRDKEASASVMLKLRPGRKLTPGNVAAIVHMVAGAVEGVAAHKVTVMDSLGNLLSGSGEEGLAKKASNFLDHKAQVEDYLARKAEDMLTAVLGPGKATVKVDATIETSSLSQTTETYSPTGKVASREELRSKSSNTVTPAKADNAQRGGLTKEENVSTEYLVSKTIEQRMDAPGKVKTVTVAAFVDLSAVGGDAGKPAMTVENAQEIISKAIGVPSTEIKVINVPFHQAAEPEAKEPDEPMFNRAFIMDIVRHGSLGLLVIGALMVLKMFGLKGKGGKTAVSSSLSAGQASAGLLAAPAGDADPDMLRTQITHALQENPDEVKRLFLSWIETEKSEA